MKKIKAVLPIFILLVILAIPVLAAAQTLLPPNTTTLPGNSRSTFTGIIGYYILIFLGVTGLLAVVFLIYGGFRYIASAGNEEQAEGAKKTIQNAIIGLVVVILSYVIVSVIVNALLPGGAGV